MSLVDDLAAPTPKRELDRRAVLGVLTGTALGAATVGAAITTVRFMWPNVLFEAGTKVKVGRPEDINPGTVVVLPEQKLYVVRVAEGFFALSAICTHLGCMTRFQAGRGSTEDSYICPCHGSHFARDGHVIGGPAPKPLIRKSIALDRGQLVVDMRKDVPHDFVLEV